MDFLKKTAFANLWLLGGLVKRQLAAAPATNALIRTTTAPTMFEGSDKENVLPLKARAVVNFRILPGDSSRSVLNHVHTTINNPRVKIKAFVEGMSEPSRVSSVSSRGYKAIQQTIRQVFPDAVVASSLVIPATDSRHYAPLSQDVYRFLPLRATSQDLRRIHGTNERIAVENYAECIRFYVQLIRNAS
jgi:carboxypeptidase PM20D1